jgi:hypothetical protein
MSSTRPSSSRPTSSAPQVPEPARRGKDLFRPLEAALHAESVGDECQSEAQQAVAKGFAPLGVPRNPAGEDRPFQRLARGMRRFLLAFIAEPDAERPGLILGSAVDQHPPRGAGMAPQLLEEALRLLAGFAPVRLPEDAENPGAEVLRHLAQAKGDRDVEDAPLFLRGVHGRRRGRRFRMGQPGRVDRLLDLGQREPDTLRQGH